MARKSRKDLEARIDEGKDQADVGRFLDSFFFKPWKAVLGAFSVPALSTGAFKDFYESGVMGNLESKVNPVTIWYEGGKEALKEPFKLQSWIEYASTYFDLFKDMYQSISRGGSEKIAEICSDCFRSDTTGEMATLTGSAMLAYLFLKGVRASLFRTLDFDPEKSSFDAWTRRVRDVGVFSSLMTLSSHYLYRTENHPDYIRKFESIGHALSNTPYVIPILVGVTAITGLLYASRKYSTPIISKSYNHMKKRIKKMIHSS